MTDLSYMIWFLATACHDHHRAGSRHPGSGRAAAPPQTIRRRTRPHGRRPRPHADRGDGTGRRPRRAADPHRSSAPRPRASGGLTAERSSRDRPAAVVVLVALTVLIYAVLTLGLHQADRRHGTWRQSIPDMRQTE